MHLTLAQSESHVHVTSCAGRQKHDKFLLLLFVVVVLVVALGLFCRSLTFSFE